MTISSSQADKSLVCVFQDNIEGLDNKIPQISITRQKTIIYSIFLYFKSKLTQIGKKTKVNTMSQLDFVILYKIQFVYFKSKLFCDYLQ